MVSATLEYVAKSDEVGIDISRWVFRGVPDAGLRR